MTVHKCDNLCVCPTHHTPLLYSPAFDDHACTDPACRYAHGMAAVEQNEPFTLPPVVRQPPPRSWTCQRQIRGMRYQASEDGSGTFTRVPEIRACGYKIIVSNPVDLPANVARHEAECVPAEDQPDGGER